MSNAEKLYQQICLEVGKESLDDMEIEKIVLFLQDHFGHPSDSVDLTVRKGINVNPYTI